MERETELIRNQRLYGIIFSVRAEFHTFSSVLTNSLQSFNNAFTKSDYYIHNDILRKGEKNDRFFTRN